MKAELKATPRFLMEDLAKVAGGAGVSITLGTNMNLEAATKKD